jgi:hypothetical protein
MLLLAEPAFLHLQGGGVSTFGIFTSQRLKTTHESTDALADYLSTSRSTARPLIETITTSRSPSVHPTRAAPQNPDQRQNKRQPAQPSTNISTMYALLTTTLTLLLTAATSANPLQKRNIGGIRLCDQPNWGGNCWYGVVPLNDCIALNSLYDLSPLL